MCNEERTGWFDHRSDFSHLGDGECAEPGIVEDALEQSNGLLANRSGWRQKYKINAIHPQFFSDLYGAVLHQRFHIGHKSHGGIDVACKRTDASNVNGRS